MPINVVLYQPEIPQNTGNIMRTCAATNTVLHLIEPLGFDLHKKDIKRSATNYLEDVEYYTYPNFDEFKAKNPGTYYFISRYGTKPHSEFDYSNLEENIYFVFGQESKGIPYDILKDNIDTCLRIPMTEKVRSLNLSNCAMLLVYEALRQQGYPNLSLVEVQKGADFLSK